MVPKLEKNWGEPVHHTLLLPLWNNITIQCLVCFRLYLQPWALRCQGNTAIVTLAEILAQACWQVLQLTVPGVMAYK